MNKNELKDYIFDMLFLEPIEFDALNDGTYKNKDFQDVWNDLSKESKDLIETYTLAYYNHVLSGIILSEIFGKVNNYELKYNDKGDYYDNGGNIIFTNHDTLNVNIDSVIDNIVEFEFMNNKEVKL